MIRVNFAQRRNIELNAMFMKYSRVRVVGIGPLSGFEINGVPNLRKVYKIRVYKTIRYCGTHKKGSRSLLFYTLWASPCNGGHQGEARPWVRKSYIQPGVEVVKWVYPVIFARRGKNMMAVWKLLGFF